MSASGEGGNVCTDESPNRLLVMGCSRRKRLSSPLMPAIERYDGPTYQVLRKFYQCRSNISNLDVYILSARFGLIRASTLIPAYDQSMTPMQAEKLAPQVLSKVSHLLKNNKYCELHLCMGRQYLSCLYGYGTALPHDTEVSISEGSMGKRQYLLKQWLYNQDMPKGEETTTTAPSIRQAATIRGVMISLSADDILAKGRNSLERNAGDPENFRAWYVELDGRRVAPKWLVSQITGLPVSSFHSNEAMRLLVRLGVKVCSI